MCTMSLEHLQKLNIVLDYFHKWLQTISPTLCHSSPWIRTSLMTRTSLQNMLKKLQGFIIPACNKLNCFCFCLLGSQSPYKEAWARLVNDRAPDMWEKLSWTFLALAELPHECSLVIDHKHHDIKQRHCPAECSKPMNCEK